MQQIDGWYVTAGWGSTKEGYMPVISATKYGQSGTRSCALTLRNAGPQPSIWIAAEVAKRAKVQAVRDHDGLASIVLADDSPVR